MPIQVKDSEEFHKLLDSATEIRVVKQGDNAKVKLRTKNRLYTYITTESEVEQLTKGSKLPLVEF